MSDTEEKDDKKEEVGSAANSDGPPVSPPNGVNGTLSTPPIMEGPGAKIGRYKLLQLIGEGGCGAVYMADQERPIHRRVAFKVIKLGMDTKQVIARFEAERQALALMDHPNIAKVLDAGATETGRPYFVMELVRGIKITDYCDQNNLSTRERLELFIQICHAVQHAHQKGIIHRDLKPSNILVTLHDGVPVPKIIDFGIAKATTGQMLTDKTLFTAYEQFVGTPAYMSPEQAEMSGLDIDTRSDIYALGVLLYELLTGQTPFDAKELAEAGLNEMRKIIREKEPLRPSTRISSLEAADQTTVAKRRHSEPPQLIHVVRGDLDWIVMRCLEKDRTRRYETANGLAQDVLNYLNNDTVTARPPSRMYRFQKLVRRNKMVFTSTALVAIALLIGLGLSTFMFFKEKQDRQQAVAAEKKALAEAAKSQQVAQFLKDMLQGVKPSVALGRDTTMLREILDRTAARVGKDLKNQPEVEMELRNIIGISYTELGQPDKAEPMHREALAIARKLWGNKHPTVAQTLYNLALAFVSEDNLDEAEAIGKESLAIRKELFGEKHKDVAASLDILATIFYSQGRLNEAETTEQEALTMMRELGLDRDMLAWTLNDLASILISQGRTNEAEPLCREALAIRKQLFGNEHPSVAEDMLVLGNLLSLNEGKLSEAESLLREQLAMAKKLYGEDYLSIVNELPRVLFEQGKFTEAESLIRERLAKANAKNGIDPIAPVCCMADLAIVLRLQGKMDEAETSCRETLELSRKLPDRQGKLYFSFLLGKFQRLAAVLSKQGNREEAEDIFREAITLKRGILSGKPDSDPGQLVSLLAGLADLLRDESKLAESEALYREGLTICQQVLPNDFERRQWCASGLGVVLQKQGKPAEAEPFYREAVENAAKVWPNDAARWRWQVNDLVNVLRRQGKNADAEQIISEVTAKK